MRTCVDSECTGRAVWLKWALVCMYALSDLPCAVSIVHLFFRRQDEP